MLGESFERAVHDLAAGGEEARRRRPAGVSVNATERRSCDW